MNEQQQRSEELFDRLRKEKKQRRNRLIRTVVIIIAAVFVILVCVVLGLRRNVEKRFEAAAAEVQEYSVRTGTIHTIVAGSGILAEEDVETIELPAGVEITEVVVEAGDTVAAGDLLATVDMATVMTSLSDLQEQLDDLDGDISAAKGDTVSARIQAGVSGRVKRIFGETGMDVSLCMAENGALAVLSLDGYMAVDLETDQLAKGDAVTVQREDGAVISGSVESAAGNRATVLVTDNGPRFDETVTVSLDGQTIGSGKLYIHNPLAVTGYAGTISSVSQKENANVNSNTTLFQLKNTSFSANYDTMLRNRADLEEDLLELLTVYRDGAVLAPMAGRISAVLHGEDASEAASASPYAMYAAAGATAAPAATATGETAQILNLYPDLTMTITISVDEMDILSLDEGQEAQIQVSSVSKEQVYPGTVTKISKVADTSTGVTQYSAEITLEKAEGMLPGMTADVDVRIQGVENALIIPIDALHQTKDTHFVYTSYDPEAKQYGGMRDVVIGMQNDKEVEILSGLQEGELIYYTEAPENIFAAFAAMSGMPMGGGMQGGARRGG